MAANVWKNSLKYVESDDNKILYETLLDFFLQRNCTYFLNKQRNFEKLVHVVGFIIRIYHDARSPECQKSSYVFRSTRKPSPY